LLERRVRTAAVIPLRLDNVSSGALIVARHGIQEFTADEVNGLAYLADQAVIALEQGSMTSRIQSIAILEERYRIAREMHDGLAQVLGYLNVQMQTLELLVDTGDTQRVQAELANAKASIRAAHADVRDSILSLRTTLSDNLPLSLAIQEYVLEFGVQTGLDAHFESNGEASPPVTPLANVEIVRIVQEALTNVRKHAQANTVHVRLISNHGTLKITVRDDGVGFDTAALQRGHFGLITMSERAQQVGGKVMITSRLGVGTTVELTVPLTLQV
jgi:signal transduction histidine kinase